MDADHQNCPLTDALMSTVDALVVILDREGRILQFNKACEWVTGFSADEVVGRSVIDTLIPTEQRADVTDVFGDLQARGANRFENDWMTIDGGRRRIMWSNATISDSTGAVAGMIGTGIDITDQRVLESRLAQADRLESVGRFAAGVAHDFNNALTSLCLRVERLASRDLDADSCADIDAITGMIGRTQDLITDLLSFSSPRAPTPVRTDVNTEIVRVHEVLSALIGSDVDVLVRLTPEPAEVLIDPIALEQILTNLVVNARDAMADGGRLTISTLIERIEPSVARPVEVPSGLAAGSYVKLSIADTGIGIRPDDLGRVFDPYFTTKPPDRGTGLGLATTYATVTQGGGAITVDSQPGCGTTFDVWFPIAAGDIASGLVPASSPGGTGARIVLVVDDDDDVRESLVEELGRLGCDVRAAASGEEAFRHLDDPIDLLVADVQLPGIGGDEVAARFRGQRPEISIVFVSGAPVTAYLGVVPDDATVLSKPVTRLDLIEVVRGSLPSDASRHQRSVDQSLGANR